MMQSNRPQPSFLERRRDRRGARRRGGCVVRGTHGVADADAGGQDRRDAARGQLCVVSVVPEQRTHRTHRDGRRLVRRRAAVIGAFVPTLTLFLIAHTCLIWLVRTLYFHESTITALFDLGLERLSARVRDLGAAQFAEPVARDVVFFSRASAVRDVAERHAASDRRPDDGNQAFQRAQRSAEAALRRLAAGD